jgi:valyl-tRNA synthetase
VDTTPPEACTECGSTELVRDPDVLDTWFSSGLWPFATLGWPEQTERLGAFYPGHVLSTAREIINLWVSRMIMLGIEFRGEVPFEDVVIHSVIQAADGRRMSKSLGTGINPLDLIERYGADGTRYGLLKMSSTQDVRFAEGMLDEGAKLANKLWNASRFVLMQTDPGAQASPQRDHPVDRWMLSRLAAASADVLRLLDAYDFAAAVKELYALIWNDFCDWYVEAAKARLYGEDDAARAAVSANLLFVLEQILALAHPVMPFVTEELWGHLPGERGLLLESSYPEAIASDRDQELERAGWEAAGFVSEVRRLAAEGTELSVSVGADFLFGSLLERLRGVELVVAADGGVPAVEVKEDAAATRAALEQQLAAARAELQRAEGKLTNEGFTGRAPAELVEAERDKARRFAGEVSDIERRLAALG